LHRLTGNAFFGRVPSGIAGSLRRFPGSLAGFIAVGWEEGRRGLPIQNGSEEREEKREDKREKWERDGRRKLYR